jgi:hypothetical protein
VEGVKTWASQLPSSIVNALTGSGTGPTWPNSRHLGHSPWGGLPGELTDNPVFEELGMPLVR